MMANNVDERWDRRRSPDRRRLSDRHRVPDRRRTPDRRRYNHLSGIDLWLKRALGMNATLAYVGSTVVVLAMLGLTYWLDKMGYGQLNALPLAAAVFSAVFGGFLPALVASLIASVGLDYLMVGPGQIFENASSIFRIISFFGTSLLVAAVVAKLRNAYIRMEEARRDAEREGRAREHVINVVSHDLRNPLASIRMYLEILRRMPDQNSIDGISRSTERMKRIIDDLLDATKIEMGTFSVDRSVEEISSLLEEAVDPFLSAASDKGIQIRIAVEPTTPPLFVDRNRIVQAVSNLIDNAVKFSREGGEVLVDVDAVGHDVRISVKDSGPGVAQEQIPSLFDRYWQAREIKHSGIGLGLFIAKGIIQSHGGKIGVISKKGQGSTFYFTLPMMEDERVMAA